MVDRVALSAWNTHILSKSNYYVINTFIQVKIFDLYFYIKVKSIASAFFEIF